MNGQLFDSFLFSVKLTKLKWSESFWTIQVQCVVNLFLCSSFRQTGLGSNFKLRNKPRLLYSVIAQGLWVFLAKFYAVWNCSVTPKYLEKIHTSNKIKRIRIEQNSKNQCSSSGCNNLVVVIVAPVM